MRSGSSGLVAVLVALLLPARPGQSQGQSAPAPLLAAMRPFDLWVGEWKGSGWSISATGVRTEFTLGETVRRRAGGTVLLIEGRGIAASGDGPETVTHDGLSLVYYDQRSGTYHWNGHEASSGATDVVAKVVEGGLEWSLEVDGRGTTIRFTIRFDAQRWHEFGEVSSDRKRWRRFMEMTLARQGDPPAG